MFTRHTWFWLLYVFPRDKSIHLWHVGEGACWGGPGNTCWARGGIYDAAAWYTTPSVGHRIESFLTNRNIELQHRHTRYIYILHRVKRVMSSNFPAIPAFVFLSWYRTIIFGVSAIYRNRIRALVLHRGGGWLSVSYRTHHYFGGHTIP